MMWEFVFQQGIACDPYDQSALQYAMVTLDAEMGSYIIHYMRQHDWKMVKVQLESTLPTEEKRFLVYKITLTPVGVG